MFLSKQTDHLHSIIKLLPYRDSIILARTMIEGVFYLRWIRDNPEMAERWTTYAYVYDFQLLHQKLARGETISEDTQQKIKERLDEYGDAFLTKAGKQKKDSNEELTPKDYKDNFLPNGCNYTSIAKGLTEADNDLKVLMEELFKPYSKWVHWAPQGMQQALHSAEDGSPLYNATCIGHSMSAALIGMKCLAITFSYFCDHFNLDIGETINSLLEETIKELNQ